MSRTKEVKQIADYIRSLEKEIKRLKNQIKDLQGLVKSGERQLPKNDTREKIIKYKNANPDATVRQIQKACKLSSTRSVTYHLARVRQFNEIKK